MLYKFIIFGQTKDLENFFAIYYNKLFNKKISITMNHTYTLYFMYNEFMFLYINSLNMIHNLVSYNDFDVFNVLM